MTRTTDGAGWGADDQRPGPRGTQHISSIAHLFFAEESPDVPVHRERAPRRVLFMGTGKDPVAANLSAGLAQRVLADAPRLDETAGGHRSVPLHQVFLGEPSRVCFSAFSHLEQENLRPPREEEILRWNAQDPRGRVARVFESRVPGQDLASGLEQLQFILRHMDQPSEPGLQALERQAAEGLDHGLDQDGADGLIWYAPGPGAVGLAAMSRLGRMVNLVRPPRVHVLVSGVSDGEAVLDQADRLLRYVAGDTQVRVHPLGPTRGDRQHVLARLVRHLT